MIWGTLMGEGERRGRVYPAVDAQIAATALRYRVSLATRNARDFEGMGVEVLNPWAD